MILLCNEHGLIHLCIHFGHISNYFHRHLSLSTCLPTYLFMIICVHLVMPTVWDIYFPYLALLLEQTRIKYNSIWSLSWLLSKCLLCSVISIFIYYSSLDSFQIINLGFSFVIRCLMEAVFCLFNPYTELGSIPRHITIVIVQISVVQCPIQTKPQEPISSFIQ